MEMLNRIVTLLLIFSALSFADDPEFQEMRGWPLEKKIEYVQSFAPNDRSPEWRTAMKALYYGFANYSVKWQRNANGLQDLRKQIEALRPLLLEIGYSEHEPDRFYAVEIGKYLQVDQEVKNMFYHVLEESFQEKGQSKNAALEAIFGYELDSPELQRELIDGLSLEEEKSSNSRFGRKAEVRSGKWNFIEAVLPLMDLIEADYEKGGKANRDALHSLKELGPAAIEVLPRIEALLKKRRADGDADFREIESLEHAVLAISQQPDPRQLQAQKRKLERVSGNGLETPRSKAKLAHISTENKKPRSLVWLYWMLGALILGGVGVIVWNSRKGSSAS